jgi:hypothetical protein
VASEVRQFKSNTDYYQIKGQMSNNSINYHYRKIAGTLSITQKAAAVPMLQIFCVNFMKREIKVL